ncbi:MAG: DUF309 domain-containing protein [Verrucomicrobiota bacterium]
MSHKSARIATLIEHCQGGALNPHYLGFFDCFNRQLFYEAHDVLEELWLADRHGPNGAFYKGLIQLAGAFVHLQKGRTGPAGALFRLAESNLLKYPGVHESLDLGLVLGLIRSWLDRLGAIGSQPLPLTPDNLPSLGLRPGAAIVPGQHL